jgi:hypothetical protein
MTLIEVLLCYRDMVRVLGRTVADQFIEGACDSKIWNDIKLSVDDDGIFVDGGGESIKVWTEDFSR